MSKIPPQLRESLTRLLQTATTVTLRHFLPPFRPLEDFLARTEHFVERFLEVGGALSELLPHLRNILLKALFYLLSEELLESSVAQAFGVFGGMVGDDIRDEGPSQPLGALIWIFRKKGIEGTPCSSIPSGRRRS